MISTDKAVNPTNIMGCTKRRLAEICDAVSLGPWRSSRGGARAKTRFRHHPFPETCWAPTDPVIPALPRAEIAKGGPVTVTILKSRASSMTIPEALPARDGGGDDLLRQSDFRVVRHGASVQNRQPGPPDDRTGGAGAERISGSPTPVCGPAKKLVRGGAQYGKYAAPLRTTAFVSQRFASTITNTPARWWTNSTKLSRIVEIPRWCGS